MRRTRWYNRSGIEAPFPWLLLGIALGILLAPVVGFLAVMHFDCCDLVPHQP